MSFKTDKKEKFVVLKVETEKLDSSISPELKSQMVVVNAEGHRNLIVDISKTRYCDSSGLSALLVGNRLCKNSNGTFVICGIQPTVMKLITISQLDTILNITPSLNEAEDFVYMEEVERDLLNGDKNA